MTNIETEEALDLADFNRVDPFPEEAKALIMDIMDTGEAFRYAGKNSQATLLEQEFAAYMGMPYALAVHSCTAAMKLALEALPGERVLIPAFTFIAVPSAVKRARKQAVLVECDENYCIDLDDLEKKARPGDILLLSYMRGWVPDMEQVLRICIEKDVILLEDAAHALGERWCGKKLGTFGLAAFFSSQSNKIINSGEGGLLITKSEDLAVRSIIGSGSYDRFHEKHFVKSDLFLTLRREIPRDNVRMDNMRAAIARTQLKLIEKKGVAFRKNYSYLVGKLTASGRVEIPREDSRAERIPDSIQFRIPGFSKEQMLKVMRKVNEAGLSLSAIGADDMNDRAYWNWGFIGETQDLPRTRKILATTCDMRLLSGWEERHFDYIANTVNRAISEVS